MSKLYLKSRDIELLKFLSRYKVISLDNSSKIYNTKIYQEKRMVTLVRHNYINRLKHRYITLGYKGIEYLSKNGINIKEHCRNESNIERLKLISDVASMTIGTDLEFTPSWKIKDEKSLTKRARRYIGVLGCDGDEYLIYSTIGKVLKKQHKAICTEIKRESKYKRFIIFSDNYNIINKDTSFVFERGKKVLIIPYSEGNKYILMNYHNIYLYEIIRGIVGELTLADWEYADYASENGEYFIELVLLDTQKLAILKKYYEENYNVYKRNITIICIEDNKRYLEKQFPEVKVTTIDNEIKESIEAEKRHHLWLQAED